VLVKAGLQSPQKKSLMHLQSRFSTVNNTSVVTQSCQHNSGMTISKGTRDYPLFPIFAASTYQCSAVVEFNTINICVFASTVVCSTGFK